MMPTLYVAGPMTGIPDFNYPHFREVGENLTDCGYRVLNPVDVDEMHRAEQDVARNIVCSDCTNGRKHEWYWYMRRTLKMMLEADGVALLRGWDRSKGAKLEVEVAKGLGIPHMPWQNWALRAREAQGVGKPGTRRPQKEEKT